LSTSMSVFAISLRPNGLSGRQVPEAELGLAGSTTGQTAEGQDGGGQLGSAPAGLRLAASLAAAASVGGQVLVQLVLELVEQSRPAATSVGCHGAGSEMVDNDYGGEARRTALPRLVGGVGWPTASR
jgi:hypothetical protein